LRKKLINISLIENAANKYSEAGDKVRGAIWPHRAIPPIDNWFERVDEGGLKKQTYLIRRRDRAPVLCAAIGQLPDADEGPGEHDGFVITTTDSAGGMVDIHDWRPVVLTPNLAREWLDPATAKERAEQRCCTRASPPKPSNGSRSTRLWATLGTRGQS
jgi:putative SOS response-associated peptidase YedK